LGPDMFSCCKEAVKSAPWIFVYENSDIYSICDIHFKSEGHRDLVKYVINMKIPEKVFLPNQVFEEVLLEKMQ